MARNNPFQRLVKTCLTEYAVTVTDLAEKLRVSRQTIYTWKRGERVPPQETIDRFCKVFGIRDAASALSGLTHKAAGRPRISERELHERKVAKRLERLGLDPIKDRDQYVSNLSHKLKPLPEDPDLGW